MAAEIQPSPVEANASRVFDIDVVEEEQLRDQEEGGDDDGHHHDYFKRAKWLRAAVLGANDGLLSTASLMMGVGGVKKDAKTMILAGVAGLVSGACGMAIGEFVSVYSQYDIELSQMQREGNIQKEKLPTPCSAALASGLAFAIGASVPLLSAAFIADYKARMGAVVAAVTLALLVFGGLSAYLGKSPLLKSCLRVLFGGWIAMAVTFGLTKACGDLGI